MSNIIWWSWNSDSSKYIYKNFTNFVCSNISYQHNSYPFDYKIRLTFKQILITFFILSQKQNKKRAKTTGKVNDLNCDSGLRRFALTTRRTGLMRKVDVVFPVLNVLYIEDHCPTSSSFCFIITRNYWYNNSYFQLIVYL